MENLESTISRILDEKFSQLLPQLQQNRKTTSTSKKTTQSKPKEDDTDWQSMNSEGFETK